MGRRAFNAFNGLFCGFSLAGTLSYLSVITPDEAQAYGSRGAQGGLPPALSFLVLFSLPASRVCVYVCSALSLWDGYSALHTYTFGRVWRRSLTHGLRGGLPPCGLHEATVWRVPVAVGGVLL